MNTLKYLSSLDLNTCNDLQSDIWLGSLFHSDIMSLKKLCKAFVLPWDRHFI